ncbi:uncharacterized protein LY89DRAFT_726625 [Mollisia scopiformis]|uniref:Heterokaryon incompatibility domain-containing protein n=1 Tax=Mollisia scopiformis TaxID=149040 RepID=A0A132B2P2_MOLSC|nr:uncharacterized protein LY89DRAFT_726625 [Mollisia scopiformis]KUJ06309.1 hypothetical protein LY89DRAFT_726625 [Mollisia scopiformis]
MDDSDDVSGLFGIDGASVMLEEYFLADGKTGVRFGLPAVFATRDELVGWEDPPLWTTIQPFLDSQGLELEFTIFNSSREPMAYWHCIYLLLLGKNYRDDFIESLTEIQYHSLRMILDWIDASYASPEIVSEILAFMAVRALAFLPDDAFFEKRTNFITGRGYDESMYRLFNMEFTPRRRPPDASRHFPPQLSYVRGSAYNAAREKEILKQSEAPDYILGPILEPTFLKINPITIHTLTKKGVPFTGSGDEERLVWEEKELEDPTVEKHYKSRVFLRSSQNPISHTLDEVIALASSLLSISRRNFEMDLIHLKRPGKSGPIVSYCPWLSVAEKTGKPRYLWDTLIDATVEYPGDVEYAAISHTWGRMALWDKALVEVPNVKWPIVQNSRFPVERLPEILKDASKSLGVRYIWFDLVCIPQNCARGVVAPQWKDIHLEQVSIQAKIFSGAKHAAVWFSDVTGFEGVKAAVESAVITAIGLSSEGVKYLVNIDVVKRIFQEAHRRDCELAGQTTQETSRSDINKWFSSLWTLQEACLRPDMIICDKNWEYLSLNGKQPLKLDGLISLIDLAPFNMLHRQANFFYGDPVENPDQELLEYGYEESKSLAQLKTTLKYSGLSQLVELTRMRILYQADQRECSRDRALAFMSAIGVTNWLEVSKSDSSIVKISDYPYTFVLELRTKLGASFFGMDWRMEYLAYLPSGISRGPGSMLPYGYYEASAPPTLTENETRRGHSSVETWQVLQNGAVRMKEAIIISSPEIRASAEKDIMIKFPSRRAWNVLPASEIRAINRNPDHIARRYTQAVQELTGVQKQVTPDDDIPPLRRLFLEYAKQFTLKIPDGSFGLHAFLQGLEGSYYAVLLYDEKETIQTHVAVEYRQRLEGIILQRLDEVGLRRAGIFRKVGMFRTQFERVAKHETFVTSLLDFIVV